MTDDERSRDHADASRARRLFGGVPGRKTLDETQQRRDTLQEPQASVEQRLMWCQQGGAYLAEVSAHLVEDRDLHRGALIEARGQLDRQERDLYGRPEREEAGVVARVYVLERGIEEMWRWTIGLGALIVGVGGAAGLALGLGLALWWRS